MAFFLSFFFFFNATGFPFSSGSSVIPSRCSESSFVIGILICTRICTARRDGVANAKRNERERLVTERLTWRQFSHYAVDEWRAECSSTLKSRALTFRPSLPPHTSRGTSSPLPVYNRLFIRIKSEGIHAPTQSCLFRREPHSFANFYSHLYDATYSENLYYREIIKKSNFFNGPAFRINTPAGLQVHCSNF